MPRIIARNPTPAEVEQAAVVAARAFTNLPLEHWQKEFHGVAEMFGERFIVIAELDGEMVSALICCPAPVYINGHLVTHSSVGGVGTVPEHRQKGCAGVMLAECARVLRGEGVYLSSLWPFSYEYYRKFGWEIGAETRSYSADGEFFAESAAPDGARTATIDDLPAIKELYNEIAPSFNCLTERSDEWWTRIIEVEKFLTGDEHHGAIVVEAGGRLTGWLAYESRTKDEKTSVECKEIFFAAPDHRRAMLSLLGGRHPDLPVSLVAPANDLYMQELPNPRAIKSSVNAAFQFRVHDPEKAMESLVTQEHVRGKLSLAVSDPVFEHGFEFGLVVDGGRISLCKPDHGSALEMSIQTFARLYSGYLQPVDALMLGKLKPRDGSLRQVALASQVFSCATPFRTWLEPG